MKSDLSTRKHSYEDGVSPLSLCLALKASARSALLVARQPMRTSLWPLMNLLKEWNTKSTPRSRGR